MVHVCPCWIWKAYIDHLSLILILSSFAQKEPFQKGKESFEYLRELRSGGIGPTFPVQVLKVVVITSEPASGPEAARKVDSLLEEPTGDIESN